MASQLDQDKDQDHVTQQDKRKLRKTFSSINVTLAPIVLTESIQKIRHWPLLPVFILMMASLLACLIFYVENEADYHSPLFMGLGLWILWRMPYAISIRRYVNTAYVMLYMTFLLERAQIHVVYRDSQWVESDFSWGLYVSTFLVGVSWIIEFIYRRHNS